MSYTRVIPRDLFNEANLLKCYGQLALWHLDNVVPGLVVEMCTGQNIPFDVRQTDDGETYVANVSVYVHGRELQLGRPCNSRESWPLYVRSMGEQEWLDVPVFTTTGEPHPEFLQLLQQQQTTSN